MPSGVPRCLLSAGGLSFCRWLCVESRVKGDMMKRRFGFTDKRAYLDFLLYLRVGCSIVALMVVLFVIVLVVTL